MSGHGFRDTFSKESESEEALQYDDSAFYFFALAICGTVLIPWTVMLAREFLGSSVVTASSSKAQLNSRSYRAARASRDRRRLTNAANSRSVFSWSRVRFAVFSTLVAFCAFAYVKVADHKAIKAFDPFEIMGVAKDATKNELKKEFRKLSLKYHPDKTGNDPVLNARFIRITKAYNALTDETARANYEKYGNPDGPQTTKVGIGLPNFLLEPANQVPTLIFFFIITLIAVPGAFIQHWNRSKRYGSNGVMVETMQLMGHFMECDTSVTRMVELLAASVEAREAELGEDVEKKICAAMGGAFPPIKMQFKLPSVRAMTCVLFAHLARRHDLIEAAGAQFALDEFLERVPRVLNCAVDIAVAQGFLHAVRSTLRLKRALIQALPVAELGVPKGQDLLQIPNICASQVRHMTSGKAGVDNIAQFRDAAVEARKGLSDMPDESKAEALQFVDEVLPKLELQLRCYVEDEKEIAVGDVCTLEIKVVRAHLPTPESLGLSDKLKKTQHPAVRSDYFPDELAETLHVFVQPGVTDRIQNSLKLRSGEREQTAKVYFQVGVKGLHQFKVHVMSDAFEGVDAVGAASFDSKLESELEAKREIIVHDEDKDLDNHPTLTQQLLGAPMAESDPDATDTEDEDGQPCNGKKKEVRSDSDDSDTDSDSDSDDCD